MGPSIGYGSIFMSETENKGRPDSVHVTLMTTEKQRLVEAAEAESMTASSWMRRLLLNEFKRQDARE